MHQLLSLTSVPHYLWPDNKSGKIVVHLQERICQKIHSCGQSLIDDNFARKSIGVGMLMDL